MRQQDRALEQRRRRLGETFGNPPTPKEIRTNLEAALEHPDGVCDVFPGSWKPPEPVPETPAVETIVAVLGPDPRPTEAARPFDEDVIALQLESLEAHAGLDRWTDWRVSRSEGLTETVEPKAILAAEPKAVIVVDAQKDSGALTFLIETLCDNQEQALSELADADADIRELVRVALDPSPMQAIVNGDPDATFDQTFDITTALLARAAAIQATIAAAQARTVAALNRERAAEETVSAWEATVLLLGEELLDERTRSTELSRRVLELESVPRESGVLSAFQKILAKLLGEVAALRGTVETFEALAVDVGGRYLAASSALDNAITAAESSWPRMGITVSMHHADKSNADPAAIEAFCSVAKKVLADEERIDATLAAMEPAENELNAMKHDAWHASRARIQAARKRLQEMTTSCALLEIPEETFGPAIAAGMKTCQSYGSRIDDHQSRVVQMLHDIPPSVGTVRTAIPKIRALYERLTRKTVVEVPKVAARPETKVEVDAKPRTDEELRLLVIIGYHLVVRTRIGKSVKGVCRVLVCGNLLAETEMDRAIEVIGPEIPIFFSKSKRELGSEKKKGPDLYFLNDAGDAFATQSLKARADARELEQRIAIAIPIAAEAAKAIRERWKKNIKKREDRLASISPTP